MAVNLTVNGQTFAYPERRDEAWGASATGWATQATAVLQHIIASASADLAQSGILRLANLDAIKWRNAANSADLELFVDASDRLIYQGVDLSSAAAGNVTGPVGATDNAIARYDGVTGQIIQDSGVTIDDSGNMTSPADIGAVNLTASADVTAAQVKANLESVSGPVLINQTNQQFTNVGDGTHNSDLNLCVLNDTGSSSLHLVVDDQTTSDAWTFTHDRASNELRQNWSGDGLTKIKAQTDGNVAVASGISTDGNPNFFKFKQVNALTPLGSGSVNIAHGLSSAAIQGVQVVYRLSGSGTYSTDHAPQFNATNVIIALPAPGGGLQYEVKVVLTYV